MGNDLLDALEQAVVARSDADAAATSGGYSPGSDGASTEKQLAAIGWYAPPISADTSSGDGEERTAPEAQGHRVDEDAHVGSSRAALHARVERADQRQDAERRHEARGGRSREHTR